MKQEVWRVVQVKLRPCARACGAAVHGKSVPAHPTDWQSRLRAMRARVQAREAAAKAASNIAET